MNRSEILIIRYRSTTVITISQDQAASPVVSTDADNHETVIDVQPNRKPRLSSLQMKKLAGWAGQLTNKLFNR